MWLHSIETWLHSIEIWSHSIEIWLHSIEIWLQIGVWQSWETENHGLDVQVKYYSSFPDIDNFFSLQIFVHKSVQVMKIFNKWYCLWSVQLFLKSEAIWGNWIQNNNYNLFQILHIIFIKQTHWTGHCLDWLRRANESKLQKYDLLIILPNKMDIRTEWKLNIKKKYN